MLALGIFVQAQLDARSPAPDEFFQFRKLEGQVLDLIVQEHVAGIRQTDEGTVDAGAQATVQGLEIESLDMKVVDIAMDFSFHVGDQGHPAQRRGEIADGLQVEPARLNGAVEADFFQKVAEGSHPVIGHLEVVQLEVAVQVPDVQVLDLGLAVADPRLAAHLVHDHAAFFPERKLVRNPFHDLAMHAEFPSFQLDAAYVQIGPVDGIRRHFPGAVVVAEPEAEPVDFHPADPEDFLVVRFFFLLGLRRSGVEDPFEVALSAGLVGQDEITVFHIDFRQVDDPAAQQGGGPDPGGDIAGLDEGVQRLDPIGGIGRAVHDDDVFQDDGVKRADMDFPDGNLSVDDPVQHPDDFPGGPCLHLGGLQEQGHEQQEHQQDACYISGYLEDSSHLTYKNRKLLRFPVRLRGFICIFAAAIVLLRKWQTLFSESNLPVMTPRQPSSATVIYSPT